MYIINNALKNIMRNKGRNILIAVIIFAVIATTVVTLMINNTASGVIDDFRTRFGAQVTISIDIDKYIQGNPPTGGPGAIALPQVSARQSLDFADSAYIREYFLSVSKDVTSDNLSAIDEGSSGTVMMPIGGDNTMGQFMLSNQFIDFDNGMRFIMDGGRMVENDNECVVSEEFAALNNLSVNDEIVLHASLTNEETGIKRPVEYNLKIVGVYYDFTEEYPGIQMPLSNKRNEILTTTETLTSSMLDNERGLAVTATYFLKDPSMADAFEAEIRAKGLSDFMAVTTDEAGYNKIIAPVEGLKGVSVTFLIIVLILGSIIIMLLSSIAIRERKYEIGVLRAMGMKKGKVALGLWSEMLVITCVCLCLGLAAGTLVAQPVSNILLAGQVEAAQSAPSAPGGPINLNNPGGSLLDSLPPLEHLDISVGAITILQIIGISLLIASLAGVASVSRITKYEPIKILMERN